MKFVNPKCPMSRIRSPGNWTRNAMITMVEHARTISGSLTGMSGNFVKGSGIEVAHKCPDMISSFIRQKAKDQGIETDFTVFDTVALSRALLKDLMR